MKTKLLVGLIAVLALLAGVSLQHRSSDIQAAAEADAKLAFSFPGLDGQVQSIAQWQGRILVINFWATWCPPCLKEIPAFIQWQQAHQSDNVQFIGIAIDDAQAVAEYLRGVEINYPILIAGDAGSLLSRQLGNVVSAVPFTVIVNQRGQIVHRQPGELTKQQFLEVVQPLLTPES